MPTLPQRSLEELAHLGDTIFEQRIRPTLEPADNGKFVAIDVVTAEYEIDEDDYAAITRLRSRLPSADVWLMRAGFKTAYRMGAAR